MRKVRYEKGNAIMCKFYCLLFIATFFSTSCCIYSFSGVSTGIKSIYIPTFENESLKYGLEDTFTKSVTDAFIKDNRLKVAEKSNADAVLLITIKSYKRTPYTYDESENVKEYKIAISANVVLKKIGSDEEMFKQSDFNEWATYYPETEEEEDGIDKVAKKFADKVIRKLLESW